MGDDDDDDDGRARLDETRRDGTRRDAMDYTDVPVSMGVREARRGDATRGDAGRDMMTTRE